MCGVAGLLLAESINDRALHDRIDRMTATMVNRGPDAEAVWIDASCGIALGHRRLAIIDLGATGAQPMTSRSQRWVISYNGELYNHPELRRRLSQQGAAFRGSSDTETLVEAIDAWGIDDALERANGMFAFAAWDRREQRLVVARDRLGEKPMYWTNDGRRLAFASELKGLITLDDVDRCLDESSARSVLAFGFVRAPATIYRDVSQLLPGQLIEARVVDGRVAVEKRQWWRLGDVVGKNHAERSDASTSLEGAVGDLDELMTRAVGERMLSDVPLGAFLSGGVDSSLVAALAQRALGGRRLQTFTVRMTEAGLDESETAARVARHLGTDHTTVDLPMNDMLALVPDLASVWDEPFADPSMLPSLILCRAARGALTVCLAGDGGDELFAGYNRHALGDAFTRRTAWMPQPLRRATSRAMTALAPATIDHAAGAMSNVLPARWRVPRLGDKVHKAAALLRNGEGDAWSSLATVWPLDGDSDGATDGLPPAPTSELSPVERMMWLDTAVVLPDDMLVKLDRASMAASLEVRLPFLSPEVLAWSWRQPMEFKTRHGVGKVVVRRLLDTMVPPGVADLPKRGFDPPLGAWLRGPLRPWAEDLLAAPRCVDQGWLERDRLRATWSEHVARTRNWEYRLWSVLMLESWLRR